VGTEFSESRPSTSSQRLTLAQLIITIIYIYIYIHYKYIIMYIYIFIYNYTYVCIYIYTHSLQYLLIFNKCKIYVNFVQIQKKAFTPYYDCAIHCFALSCDL